MLETLRSDFQRIPGLLALGAPEQPEPLDELPELEEDDPFIEAEGGEPLPAAGAREPEPASQLGLF
jgi:hypothetical protein